MEAAVEQKKKYHRFDRFEKRHGNDIRIMQTDLEGWLAGFYHGHLPSPMIHQFVRPNVDLQNTTRRMMEQKEDSRGLLEQPVGQTERMDARYRPLIYRPSLIAIDELRRAGLITSDDLKMYLKLRQNYSHFHHDYAAAMVTASIDLGTADHPNARFIPKYEILARAPEATRKLDNPLKMEFQAEIVRKGKAVTVKRSLTPDDIFGVEIDGKKQYFALEMDCATEGVEVVLTKMSYYMRIYEQNVYRDQFGIGNMKVMFVTTRESNLALMMDRAAQRFAGTNGPRGTRPFLFALETHLDKHDRTKVKDFPFDGHMFTRAYQRVGHPDLRIDVLEQ